MGSRGWERETETVPPAAALVDDSLVKDRLTNVGSVPYRITQRVVPMNPLRNWHSAITSVGERALMVTFMRLLVAPGGGRKGGREGGREGGRVHAYDSAAHKNSH